MKNAILIALLIIAAACTEEIEPECDCRFEIRENAKWTDFKWEVTISGKIDQCVEYDSIVVTDMEYPTGYQYTEIRVQSCND